ncbi:RNA-binding protein [Mesorhizobium sp. 43Arga]
MALSKFISFFTSEDLNILQKVFNQLCQERRLALKDKDQRDQLAREIMEAFEDGLTDEAKLWQSLSKRRKAEA